MGAVERRSPRRREVVAAVQLNKAALSRLQQSLGPDFHIVDIRSASQVADLVLCPPCSPQIIAALQGQFPGAQIVLAEIEDADLAVHIKGPIGRLRDAGASSYLVAASLDHLAAMLGAQPARPIIDANSQPLELSGASIEDEILSSLAARRAEAATGAGRSEQPAPGHLDGSVTTTV